MCSLDELVGKKIISKFHKLEILNQKDRKKIFFPHLTSCLYSLGFESIVLSANNNAKNNYMKKQIWLSIKVHFYIFCVFVYKPK